METKDYDNLLKNIEIDQKNLQKQKEAVLEAQRLSRQTDRICMNCFHFHQHYVFQEGSKGIGFVSPISTGHCSFPRLKSTKQKNTCKHFEPKEEKPWDGKTFLVRL